MSTPTWAFAAPTNLDLLITFADWTNFTRFANEHSIEDVFDTLNEFYIMVQEKIVAAGGLPIKNMGDACLSVFAADDAEAGILTMLELQRSVDQWLWKRGTASLLKITCHFGDVRIGSMGSGAFRTIDIIGPNVNTCVTTSGLGFVLTPEAYDRLSPDSRKRFRKFTPPITYLLDH